MALTVQVQAQKRPSLYIDFYRLPDAPISLERYNSEASAILDRLNDETGIGLKLGSVKTLELKECEKYKNRSRVSEYLNCFATAAYSFRNDARRLSYLITPKAFGGTLGIAYLGQIGGCKLRNGGACAPFAIGAFEASKGSLARMVARHEIAHSFDCKHDNSFSETDFGCGDSVYDQCFSTMHTYAPDFCRSKDDCELSFNRECLRVFDRRRKVLRRYKRAKISRCIKRQRKRGTKRAKTLCRVNYYRINKQK